MKKAVICTVCSYKYHQDIPPNAVLPCPMCGRAGRMIMGPGQPSVTGNANGAFVARKFRLPELGSCANDMFLRATHGDITLLHNAAVTAGFTLVGFHGCGSVAAVNILTEIRDVSTTNARGRGFMVGSLYAGIPSQWAGQVKGGGVATLLRVYVFDWPRKRLNHDYQWGKMDPDDDPDETGLEMVLRVRIFNHVVCLPCIGPNDQQLLDDDIWADCPTHSFRPDELPMMRAIAAELGVSLAGLEKLIETDPKRVEAAARKLGYDV
jgi:hypothetical protein